MQQIIIHQVIHKSYQKVINQYQLLKKRIVKIIIKIIVFLTKYSKTNYK